MIVEPLWNENFNRFALSSTVNELWRHNVPLLRCRHWTSLVTPRRIASRLTASHLGDRLLSSVKSGARENVDVSSNCREMLEIRLFKVKFI